MTRSHLLKISYLVQLDKTNSFTILQYIENIEYLRKSTDDANEIKRDKSKRNNFLKENRLIRDMFNTQDEEDLLVYDSFEIDQLEQDSINDVKTQELFKWINKRKEVVKTIFNIKENDIFNSKLTTNSDNIINLVNSSYMTNLDSWKSKLNFYKDNG